ncbi:uncharacterized protein LOC104432007 isoform X1 [Eucalyptus grandis]|uniref:uncharacterized protein LOC104432007 isoform X1 n=1 Tax=Eucalyptus grandis TaxID=71139 RepID=UPI00192EABC4|nr:uncharacterized protein LOC104432007 isoform X1 [Eucalyptus grandis]XP_039165000.1 uncharacterized protein LOC104432007 isoform X1 [Eucalyptus grandis]
MLGSPAASTSSAATAAAAAASFRSSLLHFSTIHRARTCPSTSQPVEIPAQFVHLIKFLFSFRLGLLFLCGFQSQLSTLSAFSPSCLMGVAGTCGVCSTSIVFVVTRCSSPIKAMAAEAEILSVPDKELRPCSPQGKQALISLSDKTDLLFLEKASRNWGILLSQLEEPHLLWKMPGCPSPKWNSLLASRRWFVSLSLTCIVYSFLSLVALS